MSLKPPLFSLGLISATTLAYEILLMRLFSIIQWHHFAYMIISLALLGYGISGTLVALLQKTFKRYFQFTYPFLLFLFSIASFSCFLVAQHIAFNPEAILWDRQQIYYLITIFILLSIPFIVAASGICLLFVQYPNQIAKIYAIDLLGAGLGSMGIILLLFYVFPLTALLLVSLGGLLATLIAVWEINGLTIIRFWKAPFRSNTSYWKKQGLLFFFLLAYIMAVTFIYNSTLWQLKLSPYKELSKLLNISGTKIIEQQSSPMGLLSIVQSPQIPFRFAPGLSLYNSQEPPEQLGLFSDASNMTAITHYPMEIEKLVYLDQVTSALPYHLSQIKQLLIVGSGGGSDILQALFHKTKHIDALELNPQIINLLSNKFNQYSGFLYSQNNINVYAQDVRGFLNKKQNENNKYYDLIQISLIDSFKASASGLSALNESYLYTVEAIKTYLQHLNQDGYLSISRWVKTPPRDSIKIFATAIEALAHSQIPAQSQHLILIRGWQTATLLIKKSPYTALEINRLKQFCQQRAFDLAWYPGIQSSETNQFNQFRQPWFYQAAKSLLSDSKLQFLEDYKYNVSPATDDKPFFHHFFKWSVLEELLSLHEQGGYALLEMAYIVLLATLIIAIISSIILILLPLLIFNFRSKTKKKFLLPAVEQLRLFIYFFSIGLAFLFIEIAMMQKFILFLHHPIYSIPVVLTAFMIFAGFGSALTKYLLKHFSLRQILLYPIKIS
jgi:hypothetical protein